MGDEIAEDLGVIAEPEVIRRRISSTDKVMMGCCKIQTSHLRDFSLSSLTEKRGRRML